MKEFDRLVDVMNHLLSPEGCPWDREQTLETLRSTVLEEACELIEAVDLKDPLHIQEELGDLLWNAVFFAALAERDGLFTMRELIEAHTNKLIRRHPHVFGDDRASTAQDALGHWEAVKAQENKDKRKSVFDGIPHGLPGLARAAKVLRRLRKQGDEEAIQALPTSDREAEIGNQLLTIAAQAQAEGIDPESALRRTLTELEKRYREKEQIR